MEKVALIYSTVDNYTYKICEKMKSTLEELNNRVKLVSIDEDINLDEFDKIMIGASIRYGKHNKTVYKFIEVIKPKAFTKLDMSERVWLLSPKKNI